MQLITKSTKLQVYSCFLYKQFVDKYILVVITVQVTDIFQFDGILILVFKTSKMLKKLKYIS